MSDPGGVDPLEKNISISIENSIERTTSIIFASEVCTPNGTLQQPRIRANTVAEPELEELERKFVAPMPDLTTAISAPAPASYTTPQRPGVKTRSRSVGSIFRGKESAAGEQRKSSIVDAVLHPQRPGLGARSKSSSSRKSKDPDGKQQYSVIEKVVGGPRYEASPSRPYKPQTDQKERHVYVLTLKLTESIADPITAMREHYFPKELNRTPAHVTLFYALPHSRIDDIQADLNAVSAYMKPFLISTGRPFRMTRGVGIGLSFGLKQSIALHDELRDSWLDYLSGQDRGVWMPHWTVMNKVNDSKKVQNAFNTIRRELFENVQEGRVLGLNLWKYEKGFWDLFQTFDFVNEHSGSIKPRLNSSSSQESEEKFRRDSGQNDEKKPKPGLKRGVGYTKEKG